MDPDRFIAAQDRVWSDVLAELRAGRKASHWMWFVFPQLAALGRSATAKHYGLSGLEDARAYLAHPVLGARLADAVEAALAAPETDPQRLFGGIDALKFRSCLTLFARAAGDPTLFRSALDRFYEGREDAETLRLLSES